MSRVFNMRTYFLSPSKGFSGLPGLSTVCPGSVSLHISHQTVFVVIAQGITHHHSLVIVIMS